MILFEEKNLKEIIHKTLEQFDDVNLSSEAAREAIAQKVKEAIQKTGDNIDSQQFLSGHKN